MGNGAWAKDNKQESNLFAEYLEKISQSNEAEEEHHLEETIMQLDEGIKFVTTTEVAYELRTNISSKKALGYDLITDEIL